MTTDNKQTELPDGGEGQDQNESYVFMKETRKKRPVDRKEWVKKSLITAAFAVAAGVLAALMFVLSVPVFQNLLPEKETDQEIVEVSSVSTSSVSSAASSVSASSAEEEKEPEETLTPEDEQAAAMEQYGKVYQGMKEVAAAAQKSTVEVIGITSQMDYFNHNYENRQSVSGVLIAESQDTLYCLTENRKLGKAESIQIIFNDDTRADAEFKAYDTNTNLAILAIKRSDIADATWNRIQIAKLGTSTPLQIGTPVIALGSMLGLGDSMEYGMISSTTNKISLWDENYTVLTTDMIGDSSGSGCLINMNGEILGIIDQSINTEEQNLVTAIPMRELETLTEDLINGIPHISIGIKGQTVSSEISESSGIPEGVLVSEVESDSPAMYAGIKELDVITAIDGQEIDSFQTYQRIVKSLSDGVEITVDAMRMGKDNYEEISFQLKPETK